MLHAPLEWALALGAGHPPGHCLHRCAGGPGAGLAADGRASASALAAPRRRGRALAVREHYHNTARYRQGRSRQALVPAPTRPLFGPLAACTARGDPIACATAALNQWTVTYLTEMAAHRQRQILDDQSGLLSPADAPSLYAQQQRSPDSLVALWNQLKFHGQAQSYSEVFLIVGLMTIGSIVLVFVTRWGAPPRKDDIVIEDGA